jgi:ribosome-binding protein aMBF1 (putative translation factor)
MEKPRTRPSGATRAEEDRDARIHAGADTNTGDEERAPEELDPDVAENYEEMIERGADQRGEGRIP